MQLSRASAGLVDIAAKDRKDTLRERALWARLVRDRDAAARQELIEASMPLAAAMAARYRDLSESPEDLLQVAYVGLVNAVDRFDPDRGIAFSSFAVPTIVGELKRHLRDRTWAVRVPRDLKEAGLIVQRTTDALATRLGRTPTAAEVAAECGLPVERVVDAREALLAFRADSLDEAPTPEGDDPLIGRLADDRDEFARREMGVTVGQLSRQLTARERQILYLRFAEDLTQRQIGERIGVSQMHVSRLLRDALARLRKAADDAAPDAAGDRGHLPNVC